MKTTSAALELNGYQLLELLGVGGSGSVYKATQVSTGQLVALKLLHPEPGPDAPPGKRLLARFERETRLCAQLHHPNIVRLLDQGQTRDQRLFAVFEFVPGCTLKDWLQSHGPMSPALTVQVMAQVLDALASAHAQGIIHRDLKPQNLMLSQTGASLHLKILDLGIAALVPERASPEPRARDAVGTPSYSAPEQLRGERATPATDLYAWGLLVLECLTGKAAINGATLAEILHKQLSRDEIALPPALQHHPLGILLRRALQKDPRERASDAAQLYRQLQALPLEQLPGDGLLQDASPDSLAYPLLTLEQFPGHSASELRRITVLCCSLTLTPVHPAEVELEAMEALQRDQLHLCSAGCQRYGGFLAGALGDSLMFFYGYPQAQEDDAQRAARSALDLMGQVGRRSRVLERQQGVRLEICITIHTGPVLARIGHPAHGLTPDLALRINRLAAPDSIWLSADTRQLLGPEFECRPASNELLQFGSRSLALYSLSGEYSADSLGLLHPASQQQPLYGRAQAMHSLAQIWHQACLGNGGGSLIVAEAGLGKSRLAHQQSCLVRQAGLISCACRCLPEHKYDTLHPFWQLLKAHLQIQDEVDEQQRMQILRRALLAAGCDLAQALPVVCSCLGLPLPAPMGATLMSAARQKNILLLSLQKLILHIGAGQPFLLILEDIHWIDQTSFELLGRLIKQAPRHALMLLLTSRPSFAAGWYHPHLQTIKLTPLSSTDSSALIADLLHASQAPGSAPLALEPASLQQLLQQTDGVPLYIEESVRSLLAQQRLVPDGDCWRLQSAPANADAPSTPRSTLEPTPPSTAQSIQQSIPASLQSLLQARISQLGAARETAQLAAAIGREFSHALLLQVALSDEAAVQAALDQMLHSRLICRQRKLRGDCYIFRHALMRDAAYESIPPQLRAQVHARIVRGIENLGMRQIERHLTQLAQHCALAGDYRQAVQYGQRASQQARRQGALVDAMRQANFVQLWQHHAHATQAAAAPDPYYHLTQALQLKYGWEPMVLSGASEARPGRVNPAVLLDNLRSIEQATPLQWAMATYHHVASNRSSVGELVERLMSLARQSNDHGLLKF